MAKPAVAGRPYVAGVGDTVMDLKRTESLRTLWFVALEHDILPMKTAWDFQQPDEYANRSRKIPIGILDQTSLVYRGTPVSWDAAFGLPTRPQRAVSGLTTFDAASPHCLPPLHPNQAGATSDRNLQIGRKPSATQSGPTSF